MKTSKLYTTIIFYALAISYATAQSVNVKPIIAHYLTIKDAFVKSDARQASQESKKLILAVKGNSDGNEELNKLLKAIREDAQQIADHVDLNIQYIHLKGLSENIYKLTRKTGTGGQEIYVQHCPMAFKNQGGMWLSAQKEIRNPYFGDKMLKCGSVKETLR